MPALDQLDDQPRESLLVPARVARADVVQRHVCPALCDLQQVREMRIAVAVSDGDPVRVHPLLFEQCQLRQPNVAQRRVGDQRQTGRAMGPRGGSVDSLLYR